MKNKKNQYNYKRNNKNKFLAKVALILLLISGFSSSLFLINQKQDTRQQASYNNGGVLITFKEISSFPKNSTVSVPVYLNTQGIGVNFLQLKININGNIKNPNIKINQKIPVEIIEEKIVNNKIYLLLKSRETEDGFSTYENTELLFINFIQETDGATTLNFDQKETIARSEASDENVITIGNDAVVRVGTILPTEVENISNTAVVNESTKQININKTPENKNTYVDNRLLIGISISSSLAAIIAVFYILSMQKREKFNQQIRTT